MSRLVICAHVQCTNLVPIGTWCQIFFKMISRRLVYITLMESVVVILDVAR